MSGVLKETYWSSEEHFLHPPSSGMPYQFLLVLYKKFRTDCKSQNETSHKMKQISLKLSFILIIKVHNPYNWANKLYFINDTADHENPGTYVSYWRIYHSKWSRDSVTGDNTLIKYFSSKLVFVSKGITNFSWLKVQQRFYYNMNFQKVHGKEMYWYMYSHYK